MSKLSEPDSLDYYLAMVCHLHHFRVSTLLEGLGLYRGQPPVLRALWEREGLTHTELAEWLHNTPATVTKTIQRMESAGFLVRRPDPADQRISRVYLTEAGRCVQARVEQVFQQIEAETFAGFSASERLVLHDFLLRLRCNLEQATDSFNAKN